MLPEGVRLAQAHRGALKKIIITDPRTALEQAVPMVLRQQLPPQIVAQLEQRVSGKGAVQTYEFTPSDPSAPAEMRHTVTLGETVYRAHFYGRRASVESLPAATVNGVAVDGQLAVSESPARPLEVGEVPDPRKQIVLVSPVSGTRSDITRGTDSAMPSVTPGTPAVEVGDQVIYLADGAHILQLNEQIIEKEYGEAAGATGGQRAGRSGFPTGAGASLSTGTHDWLLLRVNFPDRQTEVQSEASAYANVSRLTAFYQENSYGRVAIVGTVTPLLTMPHTEAWYAKQYSDNLGTTELPNVLMTDARDAARAAGFMPEAYQNFTVAFDGALGGWQGISVSGGNSNWVKDERLWTLEHEMGHALGVHHSNTWDTGGGSVIGPGTNVNYGHPKDTMGGGLDGYNGPEDAHFNACQKVSLGWLTAENYHTALQGGVYRIYQLDQPNLEPGRRYALKVNKDGARDYWLEFRQSLANNPWWMNGVSINWSAWGVASVSNTAQGSFSGTQLLDMTPGSPDPLQDAPLVIGRTFSDYEAGIHITPIGKGGTTPESLDVVVNIGAFPGNQAPALALAADTLSIAPGGTVNLTATASDPNGDALAYYWDFGDKLPSVNGTSFNGTSFSANNAATQSKTYVSAGYYSVRCTVSDMKGGAVSKTLLITVGSPGTFTLSGTITNGGVPVSDVLVSNGLTLAAQRWAYTDSDGTFTLTNLAAGSVTVSALKAGYTFASSGLANPVTVGPNQVGMDFSATPSTYVSVTALDPTASEAGGNTGSFRITRTGSTAAALTVYTEITGSATITTDYTLSPAADTTTAVPLELFTIPAGSATRDVIVTPKSDSVQEGPETVLMSLMPVGNYIISGPQTATVTIDDADTSLPRLDIVASVPETTEGDAIPAQFTVSRTGSTASALTVFFSINTGAGMAANSADFTDIGSSVVIPAGAATATININAVADGIAEGMELVGISLTSNASYLLIAPANAATPTATLKINDADINIVAIAATDSSANENGDSGRFTFTRTGSTSTDLLVYYSIGGTAMNGVDYQPLAGFVTLAAGSVSATVDVLPINDTQGEPTETVSLQIRSAPQYQISGTGNATVTIDDDGDLPVVSVNTLAAQAREGTAGVVANGSFLITTSGTGAGNITVHYTMSGTASPSADYTALSGTLSMGKNQAVSLDVIPLDDALKEDAETVILTLTPDPSYVVDSKTSATVTISDDDSLNMVSVSTSNIVANETTTGQFYFSRKASTTSAITVRYAVSGTATPTADYTALSGTVVIAANSKGTYVNVVPKTDALLEGIETIIVTVLPDSLPTPTYGIEIGSATLNIADNNTGFAVNFGFTTTSMIVAEDAGTIMIGVTRSGSTAAAVSVEYSVDNGTAFGSGVDYLCPPGRLDFAAGETVKYIPLTLIDDILPEDTETVVLRLRNAIGAGITSTTTQFTLFIQDNEPRVTIEATDPFAYETGDTAQFTVRRAGSTVGALVVPIAVTGTATSGVDYTALPASVTILDGATAATLTLTPLNNAAIEPVETVIVTLASSGNATPGAQTSATAFIGDAQSNNAPFIQIISPKTRTPAIPSGVGLSIDTTVVDDGAVTLTWSKISGPGIATFSAPSQADTGVIFSASGSYVLRLSASDGTQTSTSDLTVTVGAPISPWTNTDIGTVALPGIATEREGMHTLTFSGSTINLANNSDPLSNNSLATTDSFFLRSRHLIGDGEIRARVRFSSGFNIPRVGVMLRESTAVSSPMATLVMALFNNNADLFHTRTLANTAALYEGGGTGVTTPYWLRLVRSGNNFSAFDSPDGATWTQRGSTKTIAMPDDLLAGISVTAGSPSKTDTAMVDMVSIIGTPDNTAPSVNAGADGTVLTNTAFALAGTITDDALPSTPGATTVLWSLVNGPGSAVFGNATSITTNATFTSPGAHTLRLTADDGEVRTYTELTVTVDAPPSPFEIWSEQQFGANASNPAIAGATADPDGDGVPNLLEFAFNGDPLSGQNRGLITHMLADVDPSPGNEFVLVLAFREGAVFTAQPDGRQKNITAADGLHCAVQGAVSLNSFTQPVLHQGPSFAPPIGTNLPDLTGTGWEYHIFYIDPAVVSPARFLRAVVDNNP